MRKEALISVIVPIYNVEKYLHKCIDSIINQTYKNLEIILVDDGSPDNCGKICDEYAKKDDRIKVIHKQNGGLSDARNAGLDNAKGEYISFIDGDDYIAEDMLEVLYNRIYQDNSDMAICNFLCVNEENTEIKELNTDMPINDSILSQDEFFEKLCINKYWHYVISWNKLYRKQLFKNIRFPKGKIHEDEFVIHYIANECKKISSVKKPLYFYVQRENSIMNSEFSVKSLDGVEAFYNRTLFAVEQGYYELAEFSYSTANGILLRGYRNSKIKKNSKKRLKELKKIYNNIYFKIIFKNIKMSNKIKYSILLLSFSMYALYLKKIRKVK